MLNLKLKTLTLLAGISLLGFVYSQDCDYGWFGTDCQYKCRCFNENCRSNGTCIGETTCLKGWFGPACQYKDLVHGGDIKDGYGLILPKLEDADDETCIENTNPLSVSVTSALPFPFTWLRLVVQKTSVLQGFDVHFKNETSKTLVNCTNRRQSVFNSKTLDIHCDLNVNVQQVVLTGDGITSLCSVYISGGRNVALRQNSTQSSTGRTTTDINGINYPFNAEGAVDGVINPSKSYNCSSTKRSTFDYDRDPYWSVRLSRPHKVNRYVLYSVDKVKDSVYSYLSGFTLTSYDENGTSVFIYTDSQEDAQDVYNIASLPEQLISGVRISRKMKNEPTIVSLCEVEIYGDSICEPGTYGMECEHKCNCKVKNEVCFVSTGGCPSGCPVGFYEDGCGKECPPNFYGFDCLKPCNKTCFSGLCDRVSGACSACPTGKKPTDTLSCAEEEADHSLAIGLGVAIPLSLVIGIVIGVIFVRRKSTIFYYKLHADEDDLGDGL